ncbi:alpha-L-fucosidase [Puniceicoccaceae bacterium K14]|nr:alpha-L-fucosidase [Puniceicoccaceae bacterium K14]
MSKSSLLAFFVCLLSPCLAINLIGEEEPETADESAVIEDDQMLEKENVSEEAEISDEQNDPEPEPRYKETWESIGEHKIPKWFQDAKFGIFVHWGPYSVPAYDSEWYPRHMYMNDQVWNADGEVMPEGGDLPANHVYRHHVATYGSPSTFGYKDFIPMFTGMNFDPYEWTDLFAAAGAQYVVPMAEFHDGFAMYGSNVTRWNAVGMGPQRDILGELIVAGREKGLKVGAASHFAFNWAYFHKGEDFDTTNLDNEDLYGWNADPLAPVDDEFLELWWSRLQDLIDNYSPDLLWLDFFMDREEFGPYHKKLAAHYFSQAHELKQKVAIQSKNFNGFDSFPAGVNVLGLERGSMAEVHEYPWQCDTSIGKNSWGYVEDWESKSPNSLIDNLVDVVSKNGSLLLSVGPRADGSIPDDQKNVLMEIGSWLNVNGEAIYGTRPWTRFGEGPTQIISGSQSEHANPELSVDDFRFTRKGDTVYAFVMDWPEDGRIEIKALGLDALDEKRVRSIKLLGFRGKMAYRQNDEELTVYFPNQKIGEYAHVLKIKFRETYR